MNWNLLLPFVLLVGSAACGDDDDVRPDVADAGDFIEVIVDGDAEADVPTEVPTDVVADVPVDVVEDVPADVPADVIEDVPGDISTDVGPDGSSGGEGRIETGCSTENVDVFSFSAADGDVVTVTADTVRAATASDLWAILSTDPADPRGGYLGEGDDDFECTYPPPDYSCPMFSYTVGTGEGGTLYVAVGHYDDCADESLTEYALTVSVGSVEVRPTLVSNDYLLP